MCPQKRIQKPKNWTKWLKRESSRLEKELRTEPASRRLLDGTSSKPEYVEWLLQSRHYVKLTEELLAQAGRREKELGGDSLIGDLLASKSHEEEGHETWIDDDLEALGVTHEQVEAFRPCPAIAAYVAYFRAVIETGFPAAVTGAAWILEYIAAHCAGPTVQRLRACAAIQNIDNAVSFASKHSDADPDHIALLEAVLQTITDRAQQNAILHAARQTRLSYIGIFVTLRGLKP